MECPSCHFENRPGVRFCTQCGVHVRDGCTHCGADAEPDDQFCGDCGSALALPSAELLPVAGRRLHTRLPPLLEDGAPPADDPIVHFDRLEDEVWVPLDCALVDISQGGIGMVCDDALGVGARIRARVGKNGGAHAAFGEVVFEAPIALDGIVAGHRCGVQFDELQPALLSALAGAPNGIGLLASLGDVALDHGDHGAARTWFEESLTIALGLNDRARASRLLESFAALAAAQQQHERAIRLAGAAAASREAAGVTRSLASRVQMERWIGGSREILGPTVSRIAWEIGRTMSFQDAIDEALGQRAA